MAGIKLFFIFVESGGEIAISAISLLLFVIKRATLHFVPGYHYAMLVDTDSSAFSMEGGWLQIQHDT